MKKNFLLYVFVALVVIISFSYFGLSVKQLHFDITLWDKETLDFASTIIICSPLFSLLLGAVFACIAEMNN